MFVSKSILTEVAAGGSIYSETPNNSSSHIVRALNTFAFWVEDVFESVEVRQCKLFSINFVAEMIGNPVIDHYINAQLFYDGLLSRLVSALEKRQHVDEDVFTTKFQNNDL
jgi:hypothetical protein